MHYEYQLLIKHILESGVNYAPSKRLSIAICGDTHTQTSTKEFADLPTP